MSDYSSTSDEQLAVLDVAYERRLKREIDRVSAKDSRFAEALAKALEVEAEIERRAGG